ncbi:MAG: hypothetical protein ACRDPY_00505 [Streptosporangiaceae bacterium]
MAADDAPLEAAGDVPLEAVVVLVLLELQPLARLRPASAINSGPTVLNCLFMPFHPPSPVNRPPTW